MLYLVSQMSQVAGIVFVIVFVIVCVIVFVFLLVCVIAFGQVTLVKCLTGHS